MAWGTESCPKVLLSDKQSSVLFSGNSVYFWCTRIEAENAFRYIQISFTCKVENKFEVFLIESVYYYWIEAFPMEHKMLNKFTGKQLKFLF